MLESDPHINLLSLIEPQFPPSEFRVIFGHFHHDINYDEYDIFINTIELQTYVDDRAHDLERTTVELHLLVSKSIQDSLYIADKMATIIDDILTAQGIAHTALHQVVPQDKIHHFVAWVYL